MPETDQFHSSQDIFTDQTTSTMTRQAASNSRQDKGANFSGRVASPQPAPVAKQSRAEGLETNSDRFKFEYKRGVPLVHMTIWVHPLVKAEIQRIAERESVATGVTTSASKVAATLLEEAVRWDIHRQNLALIKPMFTKIIREEFRAFGNRIVFFLMRIAFASEQTRILATYALDRILRLCGAPKETLSTLVNRSSKTAKRKIIEKTPQMKGLLEEWERTYANNGEEDKSENNV